MFFVGLDVYFVLMGNEHSSEHNAEDFMRNNVPIKLPLAKAGAPMPDKEELDQVISRRPWNRKSITHSSLLAFRQRDGFCEFDA